MTFPLKLPWGGTIPDQAALDKYLNVQKQRAKGKGYAAQIANYHLNELKTLTIEKL